MDSTQQNQQVPPSLEVTVQQPPSEQPAVPSPWVKPLLMVLSIAVVVVLATLGIFLFVKSPSSSTTPVVTGTQRQAVSMNGVVSFEGYIPEGAYISLAEKNETEGTQQYKEVVTGLTPIDGSINWNWTDATSGQNYLIKALLKVQGKTLQESPIVDVSAPATGVVLNMSSQQVPPTPVTTSIGGQINLDGYAPSGSTLQVWTKTVDAASYQQVAKGIVPSDNAAWSWANATSGTTYLIKAQLVDANNTVISTGDVDTATAPTSNELLNVYSTAKPPTPTVTGISGIITINGNIPPSSYITLATRVSGTTTFNQVASNINATNGVGFSWNAASSGQQYDVQAYLWSNSKPYAASNIITVTAPSTFDSLTINAQQPLQAPSSSTINVSCGAQQNGNFQATINYNTQGNLPNAKSFNIVATLASQNNQVINTTVSPSNPTTAQNLTTTFIFSSGATYYAQYAYSTDGNTFSPLSPSIQFACQ
ncbi:MAG TPA: hypothetical protein VEW42_03525 [Candidatus Eisenbacteria bacterium]|nr:hypothetical protein [Candidatus Eisenbacteria bacterium]